MTDNSPEVLEGAIRIKLNEAKKLYNKAVSLGDLHQNYDFLTGEISQELKHIGLLMASAAKKMSPCRLLPLEREVATVKKALKSLGSAVVNKPVDPFAEYRRNARDRT